MRPSRHDLQGRATENGYLLLLCALVRLGQGFAGWGVVSDDQTGVIDPARSSLRAFGIIEDKVSVAFFQRGMPDSVGVVDGEDDVSGSVDALRIRARSPEYVNRGKRLSVIEGGLHVAGAVHPEKSHQAGRVDAPAEGVARARLRLCVTVRRPNLRQS